MKKLLLLAGVALAISGCHYSDAGTNLTPAHYADQTKVDEQGAVTAELAYKSWRLAVETGVDSGFIKGKTATQVAALDNKLYSALKAVEAAYAAGNASDIATSAASFNAILASGYSAIGGK